MNADRTAERRTLTELGIPTAQHEPLLAYNQAWFRDRIPAKRPVFPLPPHPATTAWAAFAQEARQRSWREVMRSLYPALRFPIEEGIAQTAAYRQAVSKGTGTSPTPHPFTRPDYVTFTVAHPPSGAIPVLTIPVRQDFEDLLRILLERNEPVPIPPSLGAMMVSGLVNQRRVEQLREDFFAEHPTARRGAWRQAWETIRKERKEAFQDRLILVSVGPYSGLEAARAGLDEASWAERSGVIRVHHECAHALCKAVLGHMGNNLLDECLADFLGLRAAFGRFRPGLFRALMGIAADGTPRPDGRMHNYLADLPPDAVAGQARILAAVAEALQRWDQTLPAFDEAHPEVEAHALLDLARFSLLEIADQQPPRTTASSA